MDGRLRSSQSTTFEVDHVQKTARVLLLWNPSTPDLLFHSAQGAQGTWW